jgi:galactose mutarotase-like enzyme
MLRLTSDDATLAIDTERGGRIRSLVVAGRELIIWERLRTIDWGSYPMAPFAGRLRDGVFEFHGHTYRLPATEGPNAIHGTTLDQAWTAIDAGTIVVELADPWPFRGRVTEQFELHPDRLDATMRLDADEPMPAVLGWHPWFIRRIDGVDAELEFRAARMYERGPDGLPTGHQVAPVLVQGLRHLDGELASRHQHQRVRCRPALRGQPLQDGEGERGRLAGAGLGAGHEVATGEDERDRLGLDGGGVRVALVGDGTEQLGRQPEISEGHGENDS